MSNCKFCNKNIIRRKVKSKRVKKGWEWETLYRFKKRRFCNRSCEISNRPHLWTRERLFNYFNNIRSKKKYSLTYLRKNHTNFQGGIYNQFGKHGWYHFLKSLDKENYVKRNPYNPKHKIIANELLKYWKDELGIKSGIIFEFSPYQGIPISRYSKVETFWIYKALDYLIKINKIRQIEKGRISIGRSLKGYRTPKYQVL